MRSTHDPEALRREVRNFILEYAEKNFKDSSTDFPHNPVWQRFKNLSDERLNSLGSELWLDSGSIEDCSAVWTKDFSALTTNNTLLNKEIQKGTYDKLVEQAQKMLAQFPRLTSEDIILEIAFILNACHGLRLVKYFDANVSVEEHTNLANDVEKAVEYAKRFHEICPERFYVKLPFSPGGLIATRILSDEGIAVNHTLGFSARQNYLIARIAKPAFVNVFLGRLNNFVAENDLGDGLHVGEKATVASQLAVRHLRESGISNSRQIGASLRSGRQVADLAGIDVLTIPPNVAAEFIAMHPATEKIADKNGMNYEPGFYKKEDGDIIAIEKLWTISADLINCVEDLENEDIKSFNTADLLNFFTDHNCPDILVPWSDEENEISGREGKIPRLLNWIDKLEDGSIGLDSLMNLAALNSFAADQKAMDDRVRELILTTANV